jgi:hypothetical protein
MIGDEKMIDYNTRLLYTMKMTGPLTMRMRIRLKEPVNGEILDGAVQKAMKRYPYLAKKLTVKDGTFVLEDNDLPVPVIETRHPMPCFCTKEMNYHMVGVDYEGCDIFFTIAHNLGGGRGLVNWGYTILYQYVWDLTGEDPNWEGVRKPGVGPEPGEEFFQFPDELPDIPVQWKGFPPEVKTVPVNEISKALEEDRAAGYYFTVFSLDEKELMARIKEAKGSPVTWIAVLYYRAIRRCLKEVPEYMSMGITCDVSGQYGCPESMSLITSFLHFIISAEDADMDTGELSKKGRDMIRMQRDPGAVNEIIKKELRTLTAMEDIPGIDGKAMFYLKNSIVSGAVPSALVSYVGHYEVPGMREYAESFVITGIYYTDGLAFMGDNGLFRVSVGHKYEDARLVKAFEEELAAEGVTPIAIERNIDQNNIGIVFPEEK